MTKFFPIASLLFVGLLFFTNRSHLMAGIMILLIQVVAMVIINWLIKESQERDAEILVPIMRQFDFFFAIGFTVWIALGVIGHFDTVIGRVYTFLGVVTFLGLLISLTTRIYLDSDLLDAYVKKDKNNDKEEDNNDRYR